MYRIIFYIFYNLKKMGYSPLSANLFKILSYIYCQTKTIFKILIKFMIMLIFMIIWIFLKT